MKLVMPYVDVIIGNEEDFEKMLGIKAEDTDAHYSKIDPENYRVVAEKFKPQQNLEITSSIGSAIARVCEPRTSSKARQT